ncbi:MAG TPA: MerR family transcriptional regulator [Spirochaetota bacterium]|nr:MerR family transcriptional regulator [Spirochaetota bacterium]HPJ39775.1 MerR family transcriptional regulator [Spirochaetota bacterium]HPQ53742.1 MerR family transcriptional regulator [Spirochaetota bacterium]
MNRRTEQNTKYSIGEVSKMVEMSLRTIRYYEELGLLNSVKRVEGGKRIYTDDDVRRLKFIKRLKILGLSLTEMKELEDIWLIHKKNERVLNRLLEILGNHLNRLDDRITDLNILRNEIVEYQDRVQVKIGEESARRSSK